ncbi:hypothetical protein WEH80_24550 [Actinomycetes bacterium KLBMP 9759]
MADPAVRSEPSASRLARARGVLRGWEDRAASPAGWGGRATATAPEAEGKVLPVAAPLAGLLPAGGLRRGTTVAVAGGPGAGSLAVALVAEASAAGHWVGVVGRPELGLVAAAEAGVRLERLALVPEPGADLLAVTTALVDGLDVVVADATRSGVVIRAADRQRLAARARQRGTVLLSLGAWPGADVELRCAEPRWEGIGRTGAGRLRARSMQVHLHGRGVAPSGRSARLLLPAPGGGVGAERRVVERRARVRVAG